MKRVILYALWILCLGRMFLSDATRPNKIKSKSHPYVFYRYENGIRVAMAGDSCNYDHRDLINDTLEIDFADFDTSCNPPSECNFVFDKDGDPIRLSIESLLVNNYILGKETMTLMSAVYFKKCICPPDYFFTYLTGSCSEKPEMEKQLYCEDSGIVNSNTFEFIILCMILVIVIGY